MATGLSRATAARRAAIPLIGQYSDRVHSLHVRSGSCHQRRTESLFSVVIDAHVLQGPTGCVQLEATQPKSSLKPYSTLKPSSERNNDLSIGLTKGQSVIMCREESAHAHDVHM